MFTAKKMYFLLSKSKLDSNSGIVSIEFKGRTFDPLSRSDHTKGNSIPYLNY